MGFNVRSFRSLYIYMYIVEPVFFFNCIGRVTPVARALVSILSKQLGLFSYDLAFSFFFPFFSFFLFFFSVEKGEFE